MVQSLVFGLRSVVLLIRGWIEVRCHEGNYGLPNILSAARAEERAK